MSGRSLAILTSAIVVLALLMGGASLFDRWQIAVPSSPASSLRPSGSRAQPKVVSGLIEADAVLISTEVPGRVETLHVEEGDAVSTGQVLAQLDTSTLDAEIQQAEAALRTAEAKLAAGKAGARSQEIEIAEESVTIAEEGVASAEKVVEMTQGRVRSAQATLQAAQAELEKLQAGPDPYEIALAETQLEQAKQRLRVAWAVRDSTGGAQQRGEVPEGSYESTQAAVSRAEVQVRIAQLQLEKLKAGPRSEELAAAQVAVEAAEAGVDAAKAQVVEQQERLKAAQARLRKARAQLEQLEAGATREQIAVVRAEVSGARAALRILQVKRDKATLRAPRAGLVLEQVIHVGERVTPGSVLLRLANLDRVKLTVYVAETDLSLVHLGESVSVSVDTYPDRDFEGEVVYVSPEAEFTPRNVSTGGQGANRVFAVKIELPNADHALKPGMPADAALK